MKVGTTLLDRLKRRLKIDARRAGADESQVVGRDADDDNDGDVDDDVDPFDPFPESVTLEIRDIIDLHTFAPRDVKRVVEAYLEEAHRAHFPSVRIIHGKGRGVQRELVRKVLARTPYVLDFTDAPPEAGGTGATVAHLSTAKNV
jgi:hypothetical protein